MKIALLMLALVFAAGCVGSGPIKIVANDGIVIEKFTADPSDVFDFQSTTFTLDIANTGGTTAKNVEAKLLNVEKIWRKTDKSDTSNTDIILLTADQTLGPPRIKDNIAGDSRFLSRIFLAPNLREGSIAAFPVKARITYDYKTTGSIAIKAISFERLQVLQNRGQSVSDPLIETNSESPLKMKFSKGSVPIVINAQEVVTGGTVIRRDFRFEITNIGSGFPITNDKVGQVGGTAVGNKIILKAPSGITLESCTGHKSGNSESFSIDLRSDGTAPLSCTLKIDAAASFSKPTDEVSLIFDFELNYRYFVEKDVSVNVQGTKTDDDSPRGAPAVVAPQPGATTTVPGATTTTTTIAPTGPLEFGIAVRYFEDLDNSGDIKTGEPYISGVANVELIPPSCAEDLTPFRRNSADFDRTGNTENVLFILTYPSGPRDNCGSEVTYRLKVTIPVASPGFKVGNTRLGPDCTEGNRIDCRVDILVTKLEAQNALGRVIRNLVLPIRRVS